MIRSRGESGRFGGPGSSHQDRDHPGRNRQETGHKGGGTHAGAAEPGSPTNSRNSRHSGGGGERDLHHTHDPRTKS
ncbi:conserved protein of unknown function [Rhodovastum atsumiense]|uniref:Uncharacterized protein n=1 Tax=Rhodovastum atsumiense TaxID=504468 RepID=A0A5M6IN80_9PROT|nr:hypothetical protein F1189_26365 [Rhodovastum atsumiense]CAH2599076.1 conserved protein of unknown function [Rhodovastum atsumiense]